MSKANKVPRAGLLALLAQVMRPARADAPEAYEREHRASPAVSVVSDYGVAPSFPGLR